MTPTPWNDSNLSTATFDQRNTKAWAIANALSSIQNRIKSDNAIKVDSYNKAFEEYSASRFNHPDLNIVPPVPDLAEVVVFDDDGWPEAAEGNEHVCPMKIYTAPVTKPSKKTEDGGMMGAMVAEGGGGAIASPFNVNVPLFSGLITAPDGSVWQRVK